MKERLLFSILMMMLPAGILGQHQLLEDKEVRAFNSIPKEEVFLHCNDDFLFSGEYLYYSFYCLDSKSHAPSAISKIGYVALLGKDGSVVFQQKIELNNGMGQGDFFIPVSIRTGHYKLIGYTKWMRNDRRASFFQGDLVIINPYLELPSASTVEPSEIIHLSKADHAKERLPGPTTGPLKIQLTERTFGHRQRVKFELLHEQRGLGSAVSISVRKKEAVTSPFHRKTATSLEAYRKSGTFQINDTIHLPELRGELISGRILNSSDGTPLTDHNIGLSIPGRYGTTKISRTNDKGVFYFNLQMGHRDDRILFELLDGKNLGFDIRVDSLGIPSDFPDLKEVTIAPTLNPVFEERSIHNQIENAFFELKSDSVSTSKPSTAASNDFQERYLLDDYTRFASLKETIVEIIADVVVRKRRGNYEIRIRKKDAFLIDADDEPLVLIDNVMVQNTSELFEYDMAKVRQIAISRNAFYIGPKKYQGIFAIETENSAYSPPLNSNGAILKRIAGPIDKKVYFKQKYDSTQTGKTEHTADFRRQLFWLPRVVLTGSKSFEFYTADNSGTYEILIEGFTEKGTPISLSEWIRVE